jgi:hypothetical protein
MLRTRQTERHSRLAGVGGAGKEKEMEESTVAEVMAVKEMVAGDSVVVASVVAATEAEAAATAVVGMAAVAWACLPHMRAGACQQRARSLNLSREKPFVHGMSCTHRWWGE